MRPVSRRGILAFMAVYAVVFSLLGVFVHRGFYTALVLLFFVRALSRELGLMQDLDEWQTAVTHRSSHIAFLVAMAIAAAAFVDSSVKMEEPPFIATFILFVSLLVKVATWQLTSRGRRRAGLVLGFVVGGFWFLFSVLSGDFNPQLLVGGVPLLAAFLALRWQRVGAAIFLLLGAVTGYFFILQGITPDGSRLFVALLLPAPLLLAGVLLLMRGDDLERDGETGMAAAGRASGGGAEDEGGAEEGGGA